MNSRFRLWLAATLIMSGCASAPEGVKNDPHDMELCIKAQGRDAIGEGISLAYVEYLKLFLREGAKGNIEASAKLNPEQGWSLSVLQLDSNGNTVEDKKAGQQPTPDGGVNYYTPDFKAKILCAEAVNKENRYTLINTLRRVESR